MAIGKVGKNNKEISLADKYYYYENSVQNYECDIEFVREQYKIFNKKLPLIFREDFCGTAAMACDWTKLSNRHIAYGVDLDPEPIDYGLNSHYIKLSPDQKKRMSYIKDDVRADHQFKSDIVVAFNFSYFIFKKRLELLDYFKSVRRSLKREGIFFLDIFGGTECCQELEEETEFENFSYYWDCDRFNPLTNQCLYYIHYKDHKSGIKYKRVFTYDWRMWQVPEIIDLLEEAGFSTIKTFWEEDEEDEEDEEGESEGNGVFYESKEEENCESWVTYIAAKV